MGIFAALFREHRPAEKKPVVREGFRSNVPGMYVIGDLAGSPVIKTSINQGYDLIESVADELAADNRVADYDVVIVGAGAAGLSAAVRAEERGLRYLVLEQNRVANTIASFPKGKKIYAEPRAVEKKGSLWLEDLTTKEEFLGKWCQDVSDRKLNIHTKEEVLDIERTGLFEVTTNKGCYSAKKVVLAIGKAGNPRKLSVPGGDLDKVVHLLIDPSCHEDKDVVVVGAGDVAAEAVIALAGKNRVTMIVRGDRIERPSARNKKTLLALEADGRVTIVYRAQAKEVTETDLAYTVDGAERRIASDLVCAMLGRELPVRFLSRVGVEFENTWTAKRFGWLALATALSYSVYGLKGGQWPFNLLPYETYTLLGQSPGFWYSFLYSALMIVFGVPAMRKWGKLDKAQYWRFGSLIFFQVVMLFVVPYIVFGIVLRDPEGWRLSGLVLAWPLFFGALFPDNPSWLVTYGFILTFVVIPILVYFHGKRYCSWVCSCGGLSETFGDRWRHYAPKGMKAVTWEMMSWFIFWLAAIVTLMVLTDFRFLGNPTNWKNSYSLVIDLYFAGFIALALYPFFGPRMWCRYWCPLQIYMQKLSKWMNGRFQISANDKCITCGECTRYCEMGIDVMSFAKDRKAFGNKETPCIGCGICVAVCPMDVLKVGPQPEVVQIGVKGGAA